LEGISKDLKPKKEIVVIAKNPAGKKKKIKVTIRIDTPEEVEYYRNGGILPYVLRQLLAKN
jgi:aconitate hydratase